MRCRQQAYVTNRERNMLNNGSPQLPALDAVPTLPSRAEFAGKIALVTGGTAGLGRHLVQTMVGLGSEVVFCGVEAEMGGQLATDLGPLAHFVVCDLADADACRGLVETAGALHGKLDYLVNNAGIDPEAPFADISLDTLDRILAIDIRAYFAVTQAAIPYLENGVGKAIVNIGTTNCMHGWEGATAYNAAKGGIIGFSRSLAREAGPSGIRVNVVSPGWIMTERQLADKVSPAAMADLVEKQSLKTLLTEQHITPATLFLLSQAAAGISGQNIVVDGGFYLQ
ncbi:MAG: SDR family oxidoreductase [Lentisphaerae bacterium]|jgi:D-xylose 1-dehydrogenase|nr:SDR family oxidoreductase [Lentisphaerota bacterium]MBT4817812.1 SDR family oxidoreductase [Lentisphaerota bacterium]MBT5612139.1 SDR family oxidoreductase [Lentisphaerota bacterium]MBT7058762.1 SDR family oxidoreductase [Lentisphaerota bacterium]